MKLTKLPFNFIPIALLIFCFSGNIFAQSLKKNLSFTPQLLCIDNNEACAIADINKDGLADVVAGRLWFATPDFVPRPLRAIDVHPPDYAKNNGEHTWDIDGDGWQDVVTTGWGETRILWYKNPGIVDLEKGLPWKEYTLADVGHGDGELGSFVDINADGRPEYIVNSYVKTNPFTIWRLDKDSNNAPIMISTEIGPRNSHGVGFGDINGDGRTDILFDEGWYEQPRQNIWGGNWFWHRDWNLKDGSCPMQIVDLNGDGRNDFIWGRGHDYGLYWFEQGQSIKDATTWTQHLIDSTWSQAHALSWADLDSDGQDELITGKRIKAHSGKDPGSDDPAFIYRYIWNKSLQKFNREEIGKGNIGTGLVIRVADLNNDGRKDIIMAGKTGTYILWQK
ncbi:MAG: VCBS repeat-containing protein [Bacteroidetes bacterium]|nr:VCBS repeat-containing protein [Bacteroidota bacterium]MDA1120136.1 VCBS repeat-containing protein [Bacteroidota bacterium]